MNQNRIMDLDTTSAVWTWKWFCNFQAVVWLIVSSLSLPDGLALSLQPSHTLFRAAFKNSAKTEGLRSHVLLFLFLPKEVLIGTQGRRGALLALANSLWRRWESIWCVMGKANAVKLRAIQKERTLFFRACFLMLVFDNSWGCPPPHPAPFYLQIPVAQTHRAVRGVNCGIKCCPYAEI